MFYHLDDFHSLVACLRLTCPASLRRPDIVSLAAEDEVLTGFSFRPTMFLFHSAFQLGIMASGLIPQVFLGQLFDRIATNPPSKALSTQLLAITRFIHGPLFASMDA